MTISFKNAGSTKLVSPVATVAPSDSLIVLNETSTFVLEDIAPGATRDIVVRVKALKEISSTNQSISTELKYSYDLSLIHICVVDGKRAAGAAGVTQKLIVASGVQGRIGQGGAPVRRLVERAQPYVPQHEHAARDGQQCQSEEQIVFCQEAEQAPAQRLIFQFYNPVLSQ